MGWSKSFPPVGTAVSVRSPGVPLGGSQLAPGLAPPFDPPTPPVPPFPAELPPLPLPPLAEAPDPPPPLGPEPPVLDVPALLLFSLSHAPAANSEPTTAASAKPPAVQRFDMGRAYRAIGRSTMRQFSMI